MGRISVKENKNEYQLVRDTLKMSRDAVEEATNGLISANRLEKIENGSTAPRPEDVVLMADVYNEPRLCNYYCVNECAIGKSHVPAVGNIHELPQIAMQLLSNLNALNKDKERLIDITADGQITAEELADFKTFRSHLDDMSMAIEALKIWADKEIDYD